MSRKSEIGSHLKRIARSLGRRARIFYDAALRRIGRRSPHVLIYTDSRGRNVVGKFSDRHYEWSYVHRLQWRARVDYVVGPASHTTILDFLNLVESTDLSRYDAVVMHCGIVDFSPRPLADIEVVKAAKQGVPGFDDLFEANADYYNNPWPVKFRGEPTINLYAPEYLRSELIPRLASIENLVWINSNHFVKGWNGNHAGRPENIEDVVTSFDAILGPEVPHIVDLRRWTEAEIREYTIDNIHFTRRGFKVVADLIERQIATASAARPPVRD